MIIVNGLQPLIIITKSSTLDVTPVLDPPLRSAFRILSIRSSHQKQPAEVFYEKRCSWKIRKMQEKNLCLRPVTLSKKTLAEVFPCEFCEISKSTFLTEYFWTTASGQSSLIRCFCESNYPAMLYLFKVNKRNTRKKCEICPNRNSER